MFNQLLFYRAARKISRKNIDSFIPAGAVKENIPSVKNNIKIKKETGGAV